VTGHPVEPGRPQRHLVDLILRITGTGRLQAPPYPPSLYSYEVYGPPTEPGGKPSSVRTRWHIGREYTDQLRKAEREGLVRVFAAWPGDGHELWCGYPSEWLFHCDMATAKRLAWWILWHWWAKSHWFGLRRWIYFRALNHKIRSWRLQPTEVGDTTDA
jgi:hypothetical protein